MVQYLLGDHLGTTSVVLNASGNKVAESRHLPYGGQRWTSATLPTDYRWTGARQEAGLGLYQMGARFYDPYINRFLSPDTIIPDFSNPQSFNRYSYVNNRPLNYIDPSGHTMIVPPTWHNPVKFEPYKLGSTGVKVLDALGQAAIMVGCGLMLGVCKVEGEVGNASLVSTPDQEFIANRMTAQVMGLGMMVDVPMPGVALGLRKHLFGFQYEVVPEAKAFYQWEEAGLSGSTLYNFGDAFESAMQKTSQINFNLTGIDDLAQAFELGAQGWELGNYTNTELYMIINNPEWLEKAVFYLDGTVLSTEEVLKLIAGE